MDSRSVEYGGLALLGVLAVALAAASLPAIETGAGTGPGSPGPGDGEGRAPPGVAATDVDAVPGVLDVVGWVLLALAVVGVLGYLAADWPHVLATVVVVAVAAVVAFAFSRFLPTVFTPADIPHPRLPAGGPIGGGGGGRLSPVGDRVVFPALVLLLAVVAGVALFRTARSRTGETAGTDRADSPDPGRVAGQTLDRLDGGTDLDDEIRRSWYEMTLLLEPSRPASTTPREFAARAADEGVNRNDVDELTRLFERVRYGGHDPTEADRRRAVAVLRQIEAAHGDGES